MTLGEIIRAGRKAAGLVQYDLADAIGVRQATVSIWETDRGIPDPANLGRIIRALDLDPMATWMAFGASINESLEEL